VDAREHDPIRDAELRDHVLEDDIVGYSVKHGHCGLGKDLLVRRHGTPRLVQSPEGRATRGGKSFALRRTTSKGPNRAWRFVTGISRARLLGLFFIGELLLIDLFRFVSSKFATPRAIAVAS
jgi:hypothetical protein